MNRIMKLCISSLMSILCVCCFWGCKNEEAPETVRQEVKARTGIDIPENTEVVYHFHDSGFQFYRRYTCFKFEENPAELLENNSFVEGQNQELETEFNYFYDHWRNNPVPNEYKANFEESYYALRKGNDFLVFFPETLLFIVYITGY